MDFSKIKTIAVDFDGTIVEDKYPDIGKPMPFAFDALIRLQKMGHRLILWTYRTDNSLKEAVDFCHKNGIEFYAVNHNHPEEVYSSAIPRKLQVDLFIDDRNVGGFLGWGKIFQLLCPEVPNLHTELSKPKGFFGFGKKRV